MMYEPNSIATNAQGRPQVQRLEDWWQPCKGGNLTTGYSDEQIKWMVDACGWIVTPPKKQVMVKGTVPTPHGGIDVLILPPEWEGNPATAILDSAIVMEDQMPPHMQQGQSHPWLAVTSPKLKFGEGKIYRIIVVDTGDSNE